jgi:plastocyanin
MRYSIKLAAVAAAAALALAACGDDDGDSGSGSDDPVVTQSASGDHSGSGHSGTSGSAGSSSSAPASSGAAGSSAPAPAGAASITITNFVYSPATLTVAPGTVITVTNNDTAPHDVDSDDGTSFLTETVTKGGTFTFTAPSTPGTYGYFCSVHPNMRGTLIVA